MLFAVLGATAWAAEDLVIVNGEHWTDSSLEQKRAYLFGVGNVLEIEQAMAKCHSGRIHFTHFTKMYPLHGDITFQFT